MPKHFEKGNKGKPKGATNKITRTVKDCFESVFSDLQLTNSKVKLKTWAQENPTEFYKLCTKLIPTALQVNAKVETIVPSPPPTAKEIKDISDKLENEC